jgi:hypothetical protein
VQKFSFAKNYPDILGIFESSLICIIQVESHDYPPYYTIASHYSPLHFTLVSLIVIAVLYSAKSNPWYLVKISRLYYTAVGQIVPLYECCGCRINILLLYPFYFTYSRKSIKIIWKAFLPAKEQSSKKILMCELYSQGLKDLCLKKLSNF